MAIYNLFVKNILSPIIAKRDGFPNLIGYLKQLEESQYWHQDKILEYQHEKLKALLIHAYETTEFYRNRFNYAGFSPYDFRELNELRKISPLTKKDLQDNLDLLVSRNFSKNEIHKDATGGSTGNHTPFYRDNACLEFKKAIEYRCNKWAGWDIGEKIAYYWPAIQDFAKNKTFKGRIKNMLGNRALVLPAGQLDEATLAAHYSRLARFKPKLMRVFPNALYILAKYIKDTNKERFIKKYNQECSLL